MLRFLCLESLKIENAAVLHDYELLHQVGLKERLNHFPNQLSAGERQRVAIARSLANSPDLILADEPTGNLDSQISHSILNLLRDINLKKNRTLVMVTHNHEIAELADRVITILDGQLVKG